MNLKLKIALLTAGYERQADFAEIIGKPESFVSNVLRGRKKLSKEDSETWQALLNCRPCILKSVTV